mmetsp:Transcript_49179/g.146902  ORF Transcript_49179/g.146902 Transcript_49179/m.146902 type:complete len:249 (+) Transcript_49179:95-841(+)
MPACTRKANYPRSQANAQAGGPAGGQAGRQPGIVASLNWALSVRGQPQKVHALLGDLLRLSPGWSTAGVCKMSCRPFCSARTRRRDFFVLACLDWNPSSRLKMLVTCFSVCWTLMVAFDVASCQTPLQNSSTSSVPVCSGSSALKMVSGSPMFVLMLRKSLSSSLMFTISSRVTFPDWSSSSLTKIPRKTLASFTFRCFCASALSCWMCSLVLDTTTPVTKFISEIGITRITRRKYTNKRPLYRISGR